jgi:hypothetical protein
MNVLPKYSYAVLEMKSSHIDNAAKGNLLKIAKIMPIHDNVVSWNMLKNIPGNLEEAQALHQWLRSDEAVAVNKSLQMWGEDETNKGPCNVHTMILNGDCFWNRDDEDKFILVNEKTNCSIRFGAKIVLNALQPYIVEVADGQNSIENGSGSNILQKMLDILSACGSVRVLVQTWATQIPYDDSESMGLGIFIDTRAMLSIDMLLDLATSTYRQDSKQTLNPDSYDNYTTLYKNDGILVLTHKTTSCCVLSTHDNILKGGECHNDRQMIFLLSKEFSGTKWKLSIFAAAKDVIQQCFQEDESSVGPLHVSADNRGLLFDEINEIQALRSRGISLLIDMQLPENTTVLTCQRKRKRQAYD